MQREIYEVTAKVVDANGTFNTIDGYPKVFDSKNYGNDVRKALNRAESAYHEALTPMYKIDTRQLQTVSITRIGSAEIIKKETIGKIADLPDPEN